jgi:hypothetical protein
MLLRLPLMLLVLLLLVQLLCCTTMLLRGIVCHVLLLLLRRQVTHGHTVLLQALQICKINRRESLLSATSNFKQHSAALVAQLTMLLLLPPAPQHVQQQ